MRPKEAGSLLSLKARPNPASVKTESDFAFCIRFENALGLRVWSKKPVAFGLIRLSQKRSHRISLSRIWANFAGGLDLELKPS